MNETEQEKLAAAQAEEMMARARSEPFYTSAPTPAPLPALKLTSDTAILSLTNQVQMAHERRRASRRERLWKYALLASAVVLAFMFGLAVGRYA